MGRISSFKWSGVEAISSQALSFVFFLALARFISPDQFGVVAVAMILVNFATLLGEGGLSQAIVYKQSLSSVQLTALFWLALIIAVCLTASAFAFSGCVARFYGFDDLELIIEALSSVIFLAGLNVVQRGLLQKGHSFKLLAKSELYAQLLSGFLSIWMAISQYGIWALVAKQVSHALVRTAIIWLSVEWRPNHGFSLRSIQDLLPYSGYLLANQLFVFLSRNVDKVLIGKFYPPSALGYYERSTSLAAVLTSIIDKSFSRVLLSTYAEIQTARILLRDKHESALLVMFPFVMSAYIWVSLNSIELIRLLFGPNWLGMAPILSIASFLIVVNSLGVVNAKVFQATGRTKAQFQYGLIGKALALLGVMIGLPHGVEAVAFGYVAGSTAAAMVTFMALRGFLPVRLGALRSGVLFAGLAYCSTLLLHRAGYMLGIAGSGLLVSDFIYLAVLFACWTMVFNIPHLRSLLRVDELAYPSKAEG